MRRALRLACLGREAAPNPMVGCVLLDANGAKVGEGYHARPGEGHAEVNALAVAGNRARGGAAYVTLEPCSFHGRTPPCADALITAGLSRVVIAMADPDERVSGSGIERLRAAGISVEIGLCEAEARRLNRAYIRHRTTGLPLVTLKTAMTLDGRIATVSGDSRWITSPLTRLWVHRQLRARIPAILVGIGTVLADDPALTVRLPHRPDARNPWRIVVDSHLRTPFESKVVVQGAKDGKTRIAYVDDPNGRSERLKQSGASLMRLPPDKHGRVYIPALMEIIGSELPATGVLVEGGAEIAAAFMEQRLVDEYICTIGPKIVGGAGAPGPIGGSGLASVMGEAVECTGFRVRRSGPDAVLRCEFARMV
jgi:diaminohydroxyphosphoribosylaminopyrimidine deaminase / 5-amino-6-(5-phosphoribosylamino)uracil reductase